MVWLNIAGCNKCLMHMCKMGVCTQQEPMTQRSVARQIAMAAHGAETPMAMVSTVHHTPLHKLLVSSSSTGTGTTNLTKSNNEGEVSSAE